jgi:hypothetical protein
MKILTRAQQAAIYNMLGKNHEIATRNIFENQKADLYSMKCYTRNEADIAFLIGGVKGMEKLNKILAKQLEDSDELKKDRK